MNKTEFINAVAEKSGLSKVDAKKAVEAFVETVSSELKEGGKVALLGFGSFSVAEKSARKGTGLFCKNHKIGVGRKEITMIW